MFKKIISIVLVCVHIVTFTGVRDALAFSAQSASFKLAPALLNEGGGERAAISCKLSQDTIGEPCIGRSQSASYILESGFIPTVKSNPPVLTQSIPNFSWLENQPKNNAFDLDDYFSSPDSSVLTYAASGNSQISAAIDSATHVVSFSESTGWHGTESVKFRATDANGSFVESNSVSLQVQAISNPPVLDYIPDITLNENDLVVISPHATDSDGEALTYSYTAPLNAQGQWQTGYASAGTYTVTVTVMDPTGLSASQQVRIFVRNVNRPPVLNPVSDIIANEGDLVTITPAAIDVDNDPLTFYYSSPFDAAGKWLTGFSDAGVYVLTVTASDGIDTVTQNVKVTINNVNRPPQMTLTASENTAVPNETLTVLLTATDQDNDPMTYVIKKDAVVIGSGSIVNSVSLQTSFLNVGDHSFTATVTDSGHLAVTKTVGINIADPNINQNAISPVMGDFNGDCLMDLGVYNSDTGTWEVALSQGGVFTNAVNWLTGFGATRDWVPVGGDFNGDGLTDVGIYNVATGEFKVALSLRSGFTASGTWFTLPGASASWQILTGNFNADKFTDLGFYNKDTGEVKVVFGTGTGFGSLAAWKNSGDAGYTAMSGDFNGDGLSDLCLFNKSAGEFKVAFSNALGFVDGSAWKSGYAVGRDPILSDFNNDGLTDIGYWDKATGMWYRAISTGSQFVEKSAWLDAFGSSEDESATTGDFNGDGVTDRALFRRSALGINRWRTQLNTLKPTDLMVEVDNGIGGKTGVTYTYASKLDNGSLPFPVYVASSTSLIDTLPAGQPEESYVQNFSFSGGYYDSVEREFRGFSKIKVIDPITGNYTETYFYQGKPGQDGALKGQIEKVLAFDGNGRQISQVLNTYDVKKAGPENNTLGFPSLTQVETEVWEENGSSVTTRSNISYDNIGNVVEALDEGDTSVSGDEKTTATTYSSAYGDGGFNRPLEIALKDKDLNVISQKDFTYDSKGNLTVENLSMFNPLDSSTHDSITQYAYDSFGNPTSVTDALNHVVTTEYETTFYAYPQKITNALGQCVTYVYDPKFGVVTSVTDANGQTSSTAYDSFGRVIEARNADNQVTASFAYPDFNTKVTTSALGLSKAEYIDGLGRKYKVVSVGEDGDAARQVSSEVYYNNRGQVEKESVAHYVDEPEDQIAYTRYEYDLRGRIKKTIADFPGTLKDAESQVDYVSLLYTETTDPQGHKKGALKDVYGNVREVTEFTSGGVFKTQYEYDVQNNLTKTMDAKGHVTQIWYDSIGRKLKMSDPDMGVWTYEYDLLGNLIKQTDAKGQVLCFEYDELNRLIKKSQVPSSMLQVQYIYDEASKVNCVGRLTKITDSSGQTEFFYDNLGREIKSTKTVDGTPYTVERTYDILDRLLTLKYPDGEVVNYSYDSHSGLLEKVNSSSRNYVNNITYNAKGQINNIQYGNNTQTTYTYGQDLRLSRILTLTSASTLQDLNYVFDKNGNIVTLVDSLRNNIRTYFYDDLDRLTQAQNVPSPQGGYANFNYQYDPIGNLAYKTDIGIMAYGSGAGPHALTSAGGYSYQYDANGNMTGGKNKTLEYDAENRIIKVTQAGVATTFTYDGDGGRVKQATPTGTTTYIGSLFEIEQSAGSGQQTLVKHIFAGSQKVCDVKSVDSGSSTVNYFHSDHLGSSSIITNQAGQQISHYEYTPYGTIAQTEGADTTRYKFTGKELDSTGLYFYGARYYDPEIGRFVTPDTIVQSPYDPQTFNRYTYCRNNPLNYVDPTGHSWFSKFFGKILGFVAGVIGAIVTGGNMMFGYQVFNFVDSFVGAVNTGNWGGFAGGVAGGLIGGYLGGGLAGDIAGMLGKQSFTFAGGFLIGAAEMGLGGFGGSFGGALGSGASFTDALQEGAMGLGIGAVTGGLMEGSYLSGMQHTFHGMDSESVGKAAKVERQMSLEIVEKPLPKIIKDHLEDDAGNHWGLRIKDNYNQLKGAWDFDYIDHSAVGNTMVAYGSGVFGLAKLTNQAWTSSILQSTDIKYITNVYGNIQTNLGQHTYKLDSYTCQTWVNNRLNLRNDNFS